MCDLIGVQGVNKFIKGVSIGEFDMRANFWRAAGVFIALVFLSVPALAQQTTLRGRITAIDGTKLVILTRGGDTVSVRIDKAPRITLVVKAALTDIDQNSFVGTAAMPQADGSVKALEVHIFPPAMRGTGEGTRDFDLQPGSTMTNATVTGLASAATETTLTLTYPGGTKIVQVPPTTPIVRFEPGSATDLVVGAGVNLGGAIKAADGIYDATRVSVGKDGLVPPM